MRREAGEVRAAVRLRLEALGRELGREPEPETSPERLDEDLPPGSVLARRRHARAVRFAVAPAQVGVVAVLVVGALAVTSWSVFGSAPTTTPVPVARTTMPSPRAPRAAPAAAAAPTAGAVGVVVDVTGRVHRPGIAVLPAGSRVVDALRKAGGPRHGVDLSNLNLARLLVDGEQIVVGSGAGAAPGGPSAGAPTVGSGPLVNLNTATLDQLDGLPGVGPVTAQKILAWRTAHGSFSAVDELLEVDGIGDKTLADLTPFITL